MGWRINCVKNEPEISEECAEELIPLLSGEYGFEEADEILEDGKLYFDCDHMEHMDYVWFDGVADVLNKHKVKGDICFTSNEGDNAGQSWGYRFDGNGNMVEVTAETTWG